MQCKKFYVFMTRFGKYVARPFHALIVRLALLTILSVWTGPNASASNLPDMGHSTSRILSPKEETQIGLNVFRAIQQSKKWANDPIVEEYIHRLGFRLVSSEQQNNQAFKFFLLQDNSLNAFALPGGFVGVHTGLIAATESESELAGVMAHEIAHVKLRHIARMYEHMGRMQLSTIVGVVASIILATQSAEAGSGAMAATLAGRQQALINYTRDHEKEADDEGMRILVSAGFDPQGMPALFQRMYQDTRYYGSHIPEYLLTHPLTQSRLYHSKEHALSFPYRQVPDSLMYHLVRARVLVNRFAAPLEAEQYFYNQLQKKTYRHHWGAQYGYALSLLKLGKGGAAEKTLRACLNAFPHQPLFQLALAEAKILQNKHHVAQKILEDALSFHPDNKALIVRTSELLSQTNPQTALSLMKQKQALFHDDPYYYHTLSNIYAKAKQPVQAHLSQAQFYQALQDYGSALTQLRLARKLTMKSSRDAKQIEARQKEIQHLFLRSSLDK